ncbi:hypothetical protein J1N35_007556 [Gossypium stocksii]|uniref:Reverse transcriptase domain-containing protein n=1 Tax=Gossypium stocksii TaxID=47602 RepID=A0A9D4AFP5_9ROSI|nr:hypothetical protein J1N35_007556 [Gossypium stocksii]
MKNKINGLEKKISNLMDGPTNENSTNLLKSARGKLGHLYEVEEKYWAIRVGLSGLGRAIGIPATSMCGLLVIRKRTALKSLKTHKGIGTKIRMRFARSHGATSMTSSRPPLRQERRDFTDEEILNAFKQMDPRKALGIDGLSGSFFKEHWLTVGKDILSSCHEILKGNKNIECLNETLIVKIPKIKNPCDMTNFRP